jgi:energy-coupling factor transporter ATP-binding protein EcfA2
MSKNLIVYGANGSGKSSFVDAVEYVLANERIEHLAHEYSGHNQLLGIRNTHIPEGDSSVIRLKFDNDSTLNVEVTPDGHVNYQETSSGLLEGVRKWDLMRTVLRQDKVADFIHRTKGQKYTELLPLLGLQVFETAAENLRKLRSEIENQVDPHFVEPTRQKLLEEAKVRLGTLDPTEVLGRLKLIAQKWGITLEESSAVEATAICLGNELNAKVKALDSTQQEHVLLTQVLDEDFDSKRQRLKDVRTHVLDALDSQIDVLIQTEKITRDTVANEIACPACGKSITVQQLRTHVSAELDRLRDVKEKRDAVRIATMEYVEAIKLTLHVMKSESLKEWLGASNVDVLAALKLLEKACKPDENGEILTVFSDKVDLALETVLRSVKKSASAIPLPTIELLRDLNIIEAAKSLKEIETNSRFLSSVNQLTGRLETGEEDIRRYLRLHMEEIISRCSSGIQRLWSTLHPDEPIEDIQLTAGEDKAVEVELKFFGKSQPSPRLTLSEGHRNSLALCIFLALAILTPTTEVPIILDDIVSSLDRDHRGRIVELLEKELGTRQILLFTHDREWYAELRSRLPSSKWGSCSLKPWIDPSIGIQFAQSKETFDDARSIVAIRPESAGNTVRSIMDYECAIAADSLQISLRFHRGDENDRRSCIEFLDNICADARRRLRRGNSGNCEDILLIWKKAVGLLKAWANRASHTGSLAVVEANQLIDACEIAIAKFKCEGCNDPIWIAEVKNKRVQCTCGKFFWTLD